MSIELGQEYIWKPINWVTYKPDNEHKWYGHTVIPYMKEIGNKYRVRVKDFPNCNSREYHNRFLADEQELEEIKNG